MDDCKKLFEMFRDTEHDIRSAINIVADRKEYEDLNTRSIKGERFACRNYLSDWYSKLTEEQKELIAEFQVLLGSALVEDKKDKEYNLNIPDVLHDNRK
jgi:hypothetical protein